MRSSSSMQTVHLELPGSSYEIYIGNSLLTESDLLRRHIQGNQAFVISNQVIADHYLDAVLGQLDGLKVDVHLMPDGEQYKTLTTLDDIIGAMLTAGHNRSTTIVALGGGVVGDTSGFAAASYQRGVPFIQVPTTLLSQVDSSVGGKTAVNHAQGKNMIGAFYQPEAVLIDTATLKTLPERELSAGLAEVIKHGALADRHYFDVVEKDIEQLCALDSDALTSAIRGSCEIKAGVVAEDEREAGKRALLNFGHTFAHAIEAGMGYGEWLHGEAVGAGMVMAADLSWRLGRCSLEDAARLKHLVGLAKLPTAPPDLSAEQFLTLMAKDKKVNDQGMRFVLLDGQLGRTALVSDVPIDVVRLTLAAGEGLCNEAG